MRHRRRQLALDDPNAIRQPVLHAADDVRRGVGAIVQHQHDAKRIGRQRSAVTVSLRRQRIEACWNTLGLIPDGDGDNRGKTLMHQVISIAVTVDPC